MRHSRPRAFVVCDLGFGDAGKGLVTDALVRRSGARLVVRYNGGAQAGHNVVTPEGHHHTFAQLGAGSFTPGVRTFLSRHVVAHPTGLLHEARRFDGVHGGQVLSRVGISRGARVITPFHQALNRLRERSRGEGRHGSCGIGVGETVHDGLLHPEAMLTAGVLADGVQARALLTATRDRLRDEAQRLAEACGAQGLEAARFAAAELSLFSHPGVIDRWMSQVQPLVEAGCVVDDEVLGQWAEGAPVVFEGAQGVLLDESIGFHPHTTWTDCTPRQAMALIETHLPAHAPVRIGVLRSHGVRHGNGPFPTEADLGVRVPDHNGENPWQGPVRYGWFDAVLARYALDRCGGVDLLALTHLDLIARRGGIHAARAYTSAPGHARDFLARWLPGAEGVRLVAEGAGALPAQEALGAWLQRGVVPKLVDLAKAADFIAWVEQELGVRVGMTSAGPTVNDVSWSPDLAD
ncbi:MAG TPA: adenylosuccinate synthetase [Myxococcaceae bacterium]|nr:adenylosuccinate synthetase [Myxococcaceae bacterium]